MEIINIIFDGTSLLAFFLKLFGIVGGFLYLFFSVIMTRQISSMKKTITINDEGILTFLGYVQVIAASLVVFYALFIL